MTDESHKLADEQAAESIGEHNNGASSSAGDGPPPKRQDTDPPETEGQAAAEDVASASEKKDVQPIADEPIADEPIADEPIADETPADETTVDEDEVAEEESAAEEDAAAEEEAAEEEVEEEEVEEEEVGEEEVGEDADEPTSADEQSLEEDDSAQMDWYILKVQSNRERSIADALRRKIAIEGLDEFFGEVVVPTEKVTEFKGGKKKIVERKLYPGYIVVRMHINDDTWFAVRETSGIGDFTGSGGKPTPMLAHEVARIIHTEEEATDETPKLDIKFEMSDKVKVKEGTFEGFEGEVSTIDDQSGKITVMINIFGRSTPVELEYWQVEGV